MTEDDRDTFERAFKRAVGVLRLAVKPNDLATLQRTYWLLLEPYPIADVVAAARTCIETLKSFPKPVEWLAALPKTTATTTAADDVRVMPVDEVSAYVRAERLRYEDTPCACYACVVAGVDAKPLRFAPLLTDDGVFERALLPGRGVVVVGMWLHGDELRRWYRARDAFFAIAPAGVVRLLRRRVPFIDRLNAIYQPVDREPGQEG